MPKYLTDDEIKEARKKGAKVPYPSPMGRRKVMDPSVKALEAIGQILSEHLKVQQGQEVALRKEMQAILKTIQETLEKVRKQESPKQEDPRPTKWKHTVKRNNNDMISEIITEVV